MRLPSGCRTFYVFGQMYDDVSIVIAAFRVFPALRPLCAPTNHPAFPATHSLSQPSEDTALCPLPVVSPFPECHIVGAMQYAAFADRLLSFSPMPLSPSMSFHGLRAPFFLAQNNITLSGSNGVL